MNVSDASIQGRVLVVDDEPNARDAIATALREAGAEVHTAANGEEAVQRVREHRPDAVVTDVRMPASDGLAFMNAARTIDPLLSIVVVSGYANIDDAVAAMRAGADHYVAKPVRGPELVHLVAAALHRRRARQMGEAIALAADPVAVRDRLVGESEAARTLRADVANAASQLAPVLVVGETGVGRQRIAETIHAASARASGPFVVVNCATLGEPDRASSVPAENGEAAPQLAAMTDAIGGTLYLENVDEMPPTVQAWLARMLLTGGSRAMHPDGIRACDSSRRAGAISVC